MVGNENKVSNYYNVSNGKIVRSYGKTKPHDIITQERINKNGDTVYEQVFDFIQAHIIQANLQTHEQYGDSIRLLMQSDNQTAVLSIKFDSAYGRSLLFKLPNVDRKKPLKISPYAFLNKEGKNIIGLNIHQTGQKIPNAYTKDNPGDLPPLKKVTFNGRDQWDKTEQLAFLKAQFAGFVAQYEQHPQASQAPQPPKGEVGGLEQPVQEEKVSCLDELDF